MDKLKVGIFVDVQNVYYTTRQAFHQHFDYNQLWRLLTTDREVAVANAYAIASHQDKQKQFHNILRGIGFQVKLKPFITRADGSAKGDWDVGITIDVMEQARGCDRLYLLSGDGDFELLVRKVQEDFNVPVTVIATEKLTASNLIACADEFIAIDQPLLLAQKKY